jgi:hypothetical protein
LRPIAALMSSSFFLSEDLDLSDQSAPQFDGDDSPETVYIAVGKAIHTWEAMEEELARLYLRLNNKEATHANLETYGRAHRIHSERVAAVVRAAEAYFQKHPNQQLEGDLSTLLTDIEGMASERHRVAHGHIASFLMVLPMGKFTVGDVFKKGKWRWACPFYSTGSLRTDPTGKSSRDLEDLVTRFGELSKRVQSFVRRL